MPVLGLISWMQAGLGPLSPCHSGVPALQRSQSRHIPFVSAWRSLFTFHWLDIPIRAADYLLTASSSSPSAGHCAVSHLFPFLFPPLLGYAYPALFYCLSLYSISFCAASASDLHLDIKFWTQFFLPRSKELSTKGLLL